MVSLAMEGKVEQGCWNVERVAHGSRGPRMQHCLLNSVELDAPVSKRHVEITLALRKDLQRHPLAWGRHVPARCRLPEETRLLIQPQMGYMLI